ncbi:50S ribosomal protein L21 [Bizionia paragorgiae]|jgi:large subunit ribosomal protein L21|uniref:50S ribosomal protein L21 n=1 Tax=Bizionia paragorgiae TaxID=283786 RepID=UPI00299F1647|nr:50S ribosomal protein L21 [Bizionia paragorgiae]MDX1271233.1 50S ribosomal protein L21 [Bizionia paragorgiae]
MYAIVEIAGHQFKVEKDQKVYVNRLAIEEGKEVSFDKVLLIADGDNVTLGAPAIGGAQVSAKVLKHLQGDKVIVFKKKRRKGYRKKNGHRQALSEIVIGDILTSGAKAAPKKEAKAEAKADANQDLSSLTVAELRDMAKAKEISGYSSMKKAELIAALS